MKIIWNQNPLRTQILLDEHEKKEFWYKIKIEEMEHLLFGAHFYLIDGKDYFDIDRARQEADPKYYMVDPPKKSGLDERVDELYQYFIGDLEDNSHCGDCTCFAASCSKCQAEHLLGIDTIKGLGKHEANKIQWAFVINQVELVRSFQVS